MDHTRIAWADATWNPWMGCHRVSAGCANCYMFREQKMFGHDPEVVRRASGRTFNRPLSWKPGTLVFTCSWSDFFIEEADEWRMAAWDIIRRTPQLEYLVLTKRPENIAGRLPADWNPRNYPHVSIGITAETNALLVKRWRELMQQPVFTGKVGPWISAEPLLEWLDLDAEWGEGIGDLVSDRCRWLVIGCESGPRHSLGRLRAGEVKSQKPKAKSQNREAESPESRVQSCGRTEEEDWLRAAINMVDDTRRRGIRCFVKQVPVRGLLSTEPAEWPEELQVQERAG